MASATLDAIASLERLARALAGHVGNASRSGKVSNETRIRKEALFTISILLPKLSAVQGFEEVQASQNDAPKQ